MEQSMTIETLSVGEHLLNTTVLLASERGLTSATILKDGMKGSLILACTVTVHMTMSYLKTAEGRKEIVDGNYEPVYAAVQMQIGACLDALDSHYPGLRNEAIHKATHDVMDELIGKAAANSFIDKLRKKA